MTRYRIKQEEKRNGTIRYSPQVTVQRTGLARLNPIPLWENILAGGLGTSKTQRYLYPSEHEALQAIEEFKQYQEEKRLNKVVKVYYKNL